MKTYRKGTSQIKNEDVSRLSPLIYDHVKWMTLRILALSGSLRKQSSNRTLLMAARQLAPKNVEIELFEGLGHLPLFNPDLEPNSPSSVKEFRSLLRTSHGLIIASPEYAHGVTGALKNSLDWITGSGELVLKPIALLNASPKASIAYNALKETLSVMMGQIIPEASLTIPLPNNEISADQIVADPKLAPLLYTALSAFILKLSKN